MTNDTRNLYAAEGLRYVPQVLTMLDQNPLSATYGCGDRQYWLYKSIDFPCGMYGEFALPLALVYAHPFPGNQYYGKSKIKDLSLAVIRNQALTAHADGSNDDFYPFERAMGSTAFTLYAMAEAAYLLGVNDDDILTFFSRRAHWLANHEEAGRLSNHHALSALGLATVCRLTREEALGKASVRIRDRVLSWQTEEGWFPEYEGFDPGYDTFTISFLAYMRRISGDDTLTAPLAKAVSLAAELVGPDGSYGGEIGNRNSYHFLPHGFELLATEMGQARYVADLFLNAVKNGCRSYLDENRTFCHYQYNYLQSWLDYADREQCPEWTPTDGVRHYPHAGLLSVHRKKTHAVVSIRKGGVVKASTENGPMASDTGLVVVDGAGRSYAPATDRVIDSKISREDGDTIVEVTTPFDKIPNTMMPSVLMLIILRLLNFTVGRVYPNLLRKAIQYLLINRKKIIPLEVTRRIRICENSVIVQDSVKRLSETVQIAKMAASTDLTTVYTASSNSWHASRLFPWLDLRSQVSELNRSGRVNVERTWRDSQG